MRIETTTTRSAEGGPVDPFERERRAFGGLLEPLRDVPDFSRAEQRAVAFIVEDIKRASPEAWEHAVESLRDALQAARVQKGIPGITWRLAQEIYERYTAFLARCLVEEQDPVRRENLEILQRGIQRDFVTRDEMQSAGKRCPTGSVILEHVPQWFPQEAA
ncbi:hypothetical protein HY634_01655 [Candidatus Uhrbacteria bacterium]|nr:hypothetical protein [Candidatus Uhrbacteria bacterium]